MWDSKKFWLLFFAKVRHCVGVCLRLNLYGNPPVGCWDLLGFLGNRNKGSGVAAECMACLGYMV